MISVCADVELEKRAHAAVAQRRVRPHPAAADLRERRAGHDRRPRRLPRPRPRQYWRAESAHFYNHEDHPLRVGNKLLTGSLRVGVSQRLVVQADKLLLRFAVNSVKSKASWKAKPSQNMVVQLTF